jgi:REP element-mobilizing transposase RayT
MKELESAALMTEDACVLDEEQRRLVEKTIADHCAIRGWILHAVNCRTNHLHVVVTANLHPKEVISQFKAWCTRRLKELEVQRLSTNPKRQRRSTGEPPAIRKNWWVERGSGRYLNDQTSLDGAILYVRDGQ